MTVGQDAHPLCSSVLFSIQGEGHTLSSDSCPVRWLQWHAHEGLDLCLHRMPCLLCWNRQQWSWRRGRREGAARRPWKTAGKEHSPGLPELIWCGPGYSNEIPKPQGNQEKCSPLQKWRTSLLTGSLQAIRQYN